MILLFSACLTFSQIIFVKSAGLNEEFSWTRLTYDWNSDSSGRNGGNGEIVSRFGDYSPSTYQSRGQRVTYATSVSSSVTMSQSGSRPIPVPSQSSYSSNSQGINNQGSKTYANTLNINTKKPYETVVVEEVPYTNWNQNGNGEYGSGNIQGGYENTNSGFASLNNGKVNTNSGYGSSYGHTNQQGGMGNVNTNSGYGSSYGSTNQQGGIDNENTNSGLNKGNVNTNSGFGASFGSSNQNGLNNQNTNGGVISGNTQQQNLETGTTGDNGQIFTPNEQNTNYDYVTNILMGANVWQNKLFITVPRRRLGVPSTLNYVPLNSKERHNVPLIPYPSWRQNAYPDQTGTGENFISVYRVAIDICDRLWFVDTGIVETLGNRTVAKPHELVVIDLQTDKILHRYSFPDSVLTSATVLASLTVDSSKEDCGNAYVYFPDLSGYGLIVYSLRENRAWRVTHNYFYLEPQAGEFRISGHDFQWNDGIFSVELTDKKPDGFRDMYFHSMAGTHMYKVSTRVLRNETLATRSYHEDDFQIVGDRGRLSQTSSADIHKKSNVMFLGLVNQNALGCWNINNNLDSISIVQKDDKKMIYPSDVKVAGDKVYVLTNTMPEFLYGRLNYEDTNFRVWSNDVSKAISGTKCQKKVSNGY